MFQQSLFLCGGPVTTVAHLHEQGHEAAQGCHFGKGTTQFLALNLQ